MKTKISTRSKMSEFNQFLYRWKRLFDIFVGKYRRQTQILFDISSGRVVKKSMKCRSGTTLLGLFCAENSPIDFSILEQKM